MVFFKAYAAIVVIYCSINFNLNTVVKAAMQRFTEKIVNMMKAEKLYETQGGPIILSQVYMCILPKIYHSHSLFH